MRRRMFRVEDLLQVSTSARPCGRRWWRSSQRRAVDSELTESRCAHVHSLSSRRPPSSEDERPRGRP